MWTIFALGLIVAVCGWHHERAARRAASAELANTRALLSTVTNQRDTALADRQARYVQGVADGRQLGYQQAEREREVAEARAAEVWEGETTLLYDMPLAA